MIYLTTLLSAEETPGQQEQFKYILNLKSPVTRDYLLFMHMLGKRLPFCRFVLFFAVPKSRPRVSNTCDHAFLCHVVNLVWGLCLLFSPRNFVESSSYSKPISLVENWIARSTISFSFVLDYQIINVTDGNDYFYQWRGRGQIRLIWATKSKFLRILFPKAQGLWSKPWRVFLKWRTLRWITLRQRTLKFSFELCCLKQREIST